MPTADLSAWHAPWVLGVLAVSFAPTIYGYAVSLARRPLFKDPFEGG